MMSITLSDADIKEAFQSYLYTKLGVTGAVDSILLRRRSSKTENVGSVVVNVLSLKAKERKSSKDDNYEGRPDNKRGRRTP